MKRLLLAAVLTLAACSEAPKPAITLKPQPVEAPRPDPDKELAARVKKALEAQPGIEAAAIDVTAAGGAVTLWGTAPSSFERRRAAQVAAKVDGVKSVETRLAIVSGS